MHCRFVILGTYFDPFGYVKRPLLFSLVLRYCSKLDEGGSASKVPSDQDSRTEYTRGIRWRKWDNFSRREMKQLAVSEREVVLKTGETHILTLKEEGCEVITSHWQHCTHSHYTPKRAKGQKN